MEITGHSTDNSLIDCPSCKLKLSTQQLKEHVEICFPKFYNRNQKPRSKEEVVCSHCGKLYANKESLHSHTKIQHPPPGESVPAPIPCDICGEMLKSRRNLQRHISDVHEGKTSDVVHEEGENTYAEENEQKNPMQESAIKVEKEPEFGHIENDKTLAKEDIKPKIVPINASSAILETTIPRHKVYVCDDCDEEFEDKHSLKKHKSEHVKVYICDDCDEEFEDKPTLKQHKSDKHN